MGAATSRFEHQNNHGGQTMLVITRKKGESIIIDGNIEIIILKSSPGSVNLGIDAPHEVGIVRKELLQPETK